MIRKEASFMKAFLQNWFCRQSIRKEAGSVEKLFYRTSSSVRPWWEFANPKGPERQRFLTFSFCAWMVRFLDIDPLGKKGPAYI